MITNIIGKKEKSQTAHKDSCFRFGDLTIKRRRNTSHQFPGIRDTLICSQFHWEAMILQSRKQDRY